MSLDVRFVPEFPNDNPALHCGVIWVCLHPTGPAVAELVERPAPIVSTPIVTTSAEPPPPPSAAPKSKRGMARAMRRARAAAASAARLVTSGAVTVAAPIDVDSAAPTVAAPVMALAETVVVAPHDVDAAPPTIIDVSPVHDEIDEDIADEEIVIEELGPLGDFAIEAAGDPAGVVPAFESVAPPTMPLETTSSLPPPSDDPFTTLVCMLADVAIAAGSPHVATLLPGLLYDGRLPDALDDATASLLRAAGVMGGEAIDPAFVATAAAWRAILRGQSDDFSACASMLDEWTSSLLARMLEAEAPRLRQDLRSRGVAAFGLTC